MKKLYSSFFFFFISVSAIAQSYNLEVKSATYTELTNPTYEIPDTSQYFGNIYTAPDIVIEAFGESYDLMNYIDIPIKQGYAYIINNTHSTTIYGAKGVFTGRPGAGETSVFSFGIESAGTGKVFVMQWKNMGFVGGSTNDYINFQIRLYENTNVIEMHFGPTSVSNGLWENGANGPTIGLLNMDESFSTIYEELWLQGSPSSPSVNTTTTFIQLDAAPSNGTLYRFSPAGTTSIDQPAGLSKFSVYPTILKNGQSLRINSEAGNQYTFSLSNISGQEIFKNENLEGNPNVQLPMLAPGIYHARIFSLQGVKTTKLVITD